MMNIQRNFCLMAWFLSLVGCFLSVSPSKAAGIPSAYFHEVEAGEFYLYNVTQDKFLDMNGSGDPVLSEAGTLMTLTANGESYKLSKAAGKDLKVGHWGGQKLWCNGASDDTDAWRWYFEAKGENTYLVYVNLKAAITENDYTFPAGKNYMNSNTDVPTDAAMANEWALITKKTYVDYQMSGAISVNYRSSVANGSFYLYDALNRKFFNTATRTFTTEPVATVTFTQNGDNYLISGADKGYLKIGVYKGQYLWSDGDNSSTKWTIEETQDNLYYIYTNNFTETNAEVAGKTWYLTGSSNVTQVMPPTGQWALITEDDYLAYAMSGEVPADPAVVAENKAAITAAKGNATSLVQNPSFAQGDGGWRGGTRTLCTLYRGNGYDYESSDEEARLIQILSNMPAGTYKVVAAVRGATGTTAKAVVANTEGSIIANRGYSQSGDQLNTNGVMMPYSVAGGFNTGDKALGWQWLTATGSLEKDGNLTLEFDLSGADWKGIADVHLYYMSDGSTQYAVDYADAVDAQNHAVCCDLTTENPNRLFSATGSINTLADVALNNLLVSGAVSNLVLWDGFDFFADADFIVRKVSYYRPIEAGTPDVLCLPFAVTGGTNGTFYEPKSINGSTLNLKEVKKPEAGKAYLYRGTTDVTALTGSGNVKGGAFTTVAAPQGSYVLNGNKLKKVFGTMTVDAFRAYFELETNVSSLTLNFDATDDDGVWQRPQLVTSGFVAGQECYLYNVDAQRFYTEGNAHGTQASVGEEGLKCRFVQNGEVMKLTNYSLSQEAWRTLFITTNGAMYVDAESNSECWWKIADNGDGTFKMMMAAPNVTYNQENYPGAMMGLDLFEGEYRTALSAILMDAEEPGEGLYLTNWTVATPDAYQKYLTDVDTYKAALQLKEFIDEAKSLSVDVTAEEIVYNNTASTLAEIQVAIASITEKLLEDELSKASRENPLDVTDEFVTNPTYANNDNAGWKGNVQPTIDVNANLQNAEFFNTNFDTYQDLQGLPEGTYRLSLQGYYRAGLEGPAYEAKQSGNEPLNAELYVTTNGTTTTTKMQSIFTGAPTSELGVDGEINLGSWWVPNTMSSAAVYFAKDYYKGNNIEVQVTNGQLRIGLRKTTTLRRDWVMIDNWKLEYLGKE